jgi:hypothetical protein
MSSPPPSQHHSSAVGEEILSEERRESVKENLQWNSNLWFHLIIWTIIFPFLHKQI